MSANRPFTLTPYARSIFKQLMQPQQQQRPMAQPPQITPQQIEAARAAWQKRQPVGSSKTGPRF